MVVGAIAYLKLCNKIFNKNFVALSLFFVALGLFKVFDTNVCGMFPGGRP